MAALAQNPQDVAQKHTGILLNRHACGAGMHHLRGLVEKLLRVDSHGSGGHHTEIKERGIFPPRCGIPEKKLAETTPPHHPLPLPTNHLGGNPPIPPPPPHHPPSP